MMLLAATESLKWEKQRLFELLKRPEPTPGLGQAPAYEADDGPLTDEQLDQIRASAQPEPLLEKHPYLNNGFVHFKNLKPMVHHADTPAPTPAEDIDDDVLAEDEHPNIKDAIKAWKLANPGETIKDQRYRLSRGEISELPWMGLVADNALPVATNSGFGISFPAAASKGDTFIRVDRLPNQVYKFNGTNWIQVDKQLSDSYTYDEAYIDYLIEKIAAGEYDAELLSDSEREQVAIRLQQTKQ